MRYHSLKVFMGSESKQGGIMRLELNTKDESLKEILGNGKQYLVPRFQRDYSWEKEHWEDLWSDIMAVLDGEESYHYIGYLVLQPPLKNQSEKKKTNTEKIIIIDGQQRLTTISLLVLAAIKRLKEIQKEQPDHREREEERISELHRNYIGTKDEVMLQIDNKLTLNRNNDFHYRQIVEGYGIPRAKHKHTVKLMKSAFEFFCEKFKSYNKGEDIARVIKTISESFLFTTIYIGDELNAYKVFETLNARGVKLSSTDLLKNYIFSLIDKENNAPDDVIDRLDEKWKQIGENIGDTHYTDLALTKWNSEHKFVRKAQLFKEVRKSITSQQEANVYLQSLLDTSYVYSALLDYNSDYWKDYDEHKSIIKGLAVLHLFGVRQPLSLLLASNTYCREDFAKILKWIVALTMRYNVIGRGHAGEQEQLYSKICITIQKAQNIKEIKHKIKTMLLELYPNDNKFKEDFSDKSFPSGPSRNGRMKYILARLSEHRSTEKNDEEPLTLEHILPQKPNDEWQNSFGNDWHLFTQRLGNMALVDANTNKTSLGQKLFIEKREVLASSAYIINQGINQYQEWNAESVASRQRHMAEIACQVWRIE